MVGDYFYIPALILYIPYMTYRHADPVVEARRRLGRRLFLCNPDTGLVRLIDIPDAPRPLLHAYAFTHTLLSIFHRMTTRENMMAEFALSPEVEASGPNTSAITSAVTFQHHSTPESQSSPQSASANGTKKKLKRNRIIL